MTRANSGKRGGLLRHYLSIFGVLGIALAIGMHSAWSATTDVAASRPLSVVTTPVAPFVLPKTDPPAGFSIDLWNEVARRMHVEFVWREVPQPELLQAVQRGDADVAIAAITMTTEREMLVDFSHPYFDSGLQIMVRAQQESRFLSALRSMPWQAIGHLFAAAIVIVFLLANVLWLVERRRNSNFAKGYLRAIGEGLWGTMLIIATGEHGDRDAPGVVKRVTVVLMWLLGVVLIAQLTAIVTSSQTVERLQSSIHGPDDLPGKTIASVKGTIAGDYLAHRGLPFVNVNYGPEAIRMLSEGEVQAVVFDAPTLQYWAAKQGQGVVQVVGPLFRQEKYAIAVAEGSDLRKKINEAILTIYEDGTYEKIYARWFSANQ
ncbi:MAG: transporter substrate-binding domain-containing protein [Propionivibrio sp.]|uniref:transporter substrate-binding domain-containing protein n=1 Tax=Propionivibrio sp. TaxID=2212460 RepID=UPI001A5C2697|nr:transporter substrate-binding domain-containing protein [Propionivibrio sp.]MBL8414881.1 transporter substrate-binding domain-containing protein [Propionivibrio sp.]